MTEWWNALDTFQKVVFVFAAPATVLMIIFLILMIIGFDNDESFDGIGDVDSINDESLLSVGGLKIFTVRGILAFLSIGGWTAMSLAYYMDDVWAGLLGLLAGLIAAVLVAWAIHAAMKLESIGNVDYKNAMGKVGDVYVRVPKSRSGKGKITITFQERFMEVDAVTDEPEDLLPKTSVIVSGLENENTVIVSRNIKN